jgi:rod shape-determining protein MreB
LVIGQPTAEQIKIQVGSAINLPEDLTTEVQGRDQVGGLPRSITISTSEVVEAIAETLTTIANVGRQVLEKTPPELASDIIDRGVTLTGGVALLRGIDEFITRHIGVPAFRADDPIVCTAVGAGRVQDDPAIMRRISGST